MRKILCVAGVVVLLGTLTGCKKYYYPETTQEFDPGVVVEEYTVVE